MVFCSAESFYKVLDLDSIGDHPYDLTHEKGYVVNFTSAGGVLKEGIHESCF